MRRSILARGRPAAPDAAPDAAPADPLATAKPANLWRDTAANVLRQRSAMIGLIILTSLILVAIFAPLIATHDPEAVFIGKEVGARPFTPPCIHLLGCPEEQGQHIFGLDGNGRDVFSRVLFGARVSLQVGVTAIALAITAGMMIGALAGYLGGAVDNVFMRFMDVLLAFPALLLAIGIVSALGSGLTNALVAISIVAIPAFARVMRASVLSVKANDYVTASQALGESTIGILTRRILPNSITPLVVTGTLAIGGAVLEIAALAFIGVVGISQPEWGTMIGLARNYMFSAPHTVIVPGIAITLTVLGFNLLGDGLRDALDPRLNR